MPYRKPTFALPRSYPRRVALAVALAPFAVAALLGVIAVTRARPLPPHARPR